jgi:hypothetical protein
LRSVSCKKVVAVCQFLANFGSKNIAQLVTDVEDGALAPSINARFRLDIFASAIVTQIVGVPMDNPFTR